MVDVLVAAAEGDEARAHGLARAFEALGFEAVTFQPAPVAETVEAGADGAPPAAPTPDMAMLAEAACVVVAWTAAGAARLKETAKAAGEKLVNLELDAAATPKAFQAQACIDLDTQDRLEFKSRFEALIAEIERVVGAKGDAGGFFNALAEARLALQRALPPVLVPEAPPPAPAPKPPTRRGSRLWAVAAVSTVSLFSIGYLAARFIGAEPSRESSAAAATSRPVDGGDAKARAPAANPAAPGARYGVTRADLEGLAWRDAAAKIEAGSAARINADARGGDAFAATLACLGHMTGAGGFLPSPTAARAACDIAAAAHEPAALYLTWSLSRSAPHAGIDAATARARLAEAAQLGWLPAQVDYALVLADEFRAPLADQLEAGRLLLTAAQRGDAGAQYHYARWLRDSRAGPRDPAAALPFLESASERNHAEALHALATLYRDGHGVPTDAARAKALYERAAAQAYAPSMFNLADLLRRGGEPDRARAVTLFRSLACLRDNRQIQSLAMARLRAMGQVVSCG